MTWAELSEAHLASAKWLMESGEDVHYRAVCGRAYYCVYALITSKLPAGTTFGRHRNPDHNDLPKFVGQIAGLDKVARQRIRRSISRLRQHREDADYRPRITIERQDAMDCLRDVKDVLRQFR